MKSKRRRNAPKYAKQATTAWNVRMRGSLKRSIRFPASGFASEVFKSDRKVVVDTVVSPGSLDFSVNVFI